MAKAAVQLEGTKKLAKALDSLPRELRKQIARKGLTKAARVVAKAMKSKLPTTRQAEDQVLVSLRKSIGTRSKTYGKHGVVFRAVGPRYSYIDSKNPKGGQVSKFADAIEFGTSKMVKRHGVMQRALPFHPFARPGLLASKTQAFNTMVREMRAAMPGVIAKAKAKGKL